MEILSFVHFPHLAASLPSSSRFVPLLSSTLLYTPRPSPFLPSPCLSSLFLFTLLAAHLLSSPLLVFPLRSSTLLRLNSPLLSSSLLVPSPFFLFPCLASSILPSPCLSSPLLSSPHLPSPCLSSRFLFTLLASPLYATITLTGFRYVVFYSHLFVA